MPDATTASQFVLLGVVIVLTAAIVIYFVASLILKLRGPK